MARINIEEKWWSDPRRIRLSIAMNSQFSADGAYFQAVRLAQDFWCNKVSPKSLIPADVFERSGLPKNLVDCDLLTKIEDFYYLRGSEQHFAWWFSASDAGKKSAESRKKKYGTSQPNNTEQASNDLRTPFERSRTSSSSSSSKKENTTTTDLKDKISQAWEVWRGTQEAFGIPPQEISPVQEMSIARAIQQIGFDNVLLALEGQRHEPATKTFDPITSLSIDRALHRNSRGESRWEKFTNMALAVRERVKSKQNTDEIAQGFLNND